MHQVLERSILLTPWAFPLLSVAPLLACSFKLEIRVTLNLPPSSPYHSSYPKPVVNSKPYCIPAALCPLPSLLKLCLCSCSFSVVFNSNFIHLCLPSFIHLLGAPAKGQNLLNSLKTEQETMDNRNMNTCIYIQ